MLLKLFADTQSHVNQRDNMEPLILLVIEKMLLLWKLMYEEKKEKGIIEWKQEKRTGLAK